MCCAGKQVLVGGGHLDLPSCKQLCPSAAPARALRQRSHDYLAVQRSLNTTLNDGTCILCNPEEVHKLAAGTLLLLLLLNYVLQLKYRIKC